MTEGATRLTRPMVRDQGELRPASWEEALDRAAAGFRAAAAPPGPSPFALFGCSRATNEVNYLAQKFARGVLGSNNVDCGAGPGHSPGVAGLAGIFGAGGGTSSYLDLEETEVVLLWGSDPRQTHPVFFLHLVRALSGGARLHVVDPLLSSSARWAHLHLALRPGTDLALAGALGREIIAAGLLDDAFIRRATSGFPAYRESVERFTLREGERLTGIPAGSIQLAAHDYAGARRAQICWTPGIGESDGGPGLVPALADLALLTGHVGRHGSGLLPLQRRNNAQGAADMGAIPDRLPGFQSLENDVARRKFERAWGTAIPSGPGLGRREMLEAMERGEIRSAYVIGEDLARPEGGGSRTPRLPGKVEHLVVQDLFLTPTARAAHVVLPAAASWCEAEGTVTSSERRVQRVRKALDPPGEARDDLRILCDLARRLGHDWGNPGAEEVWNEVRSLSPLHAGISYARLEELKGITWPCPDERHPGESFLHARLWADPMPGPRVPFWPLPLSAPAGGKGGEPWI